MAKQSAQPVGTTAEIDSGYLVIRTPMNVPPRQSASGKTLLVAGTGGFAVTNLQIDGKPVSISLNATIPNK